jgi:hypothetical protein
VKNMPLKHYLLPSPNAYPHRIAITGGLGLARNSSATIPMRSQMIHQSFYWLETPLTQINTLQLVEKELRAASEHSPMHPHERHI